MKGVSEHKRAVGTVFEIDTSKAEYQGIPWRLLGDFGKRKFENLIFLQNTYSNPKFIYA